MSNEPEKRAINYLAQLWAMRPFSTAISPPQAIARLELDNLAEIENSVENEMGCDDYHQLITIPELRDNFADDI